MTYTFPFTNVVIEPATICHLCGAQHAYSASCNTTIRPRPPVKMPKP